MEETRDAFEKAAQTRDADLMLQANLDFHSKIADCCQNRILANSYRQLLTGNLRIARLAMSYEYYDSEFLFNDHLDNILREHVEMVEAIKDQKALKAIAMATGLHSIPRATMKEAMTAKVVQIIFYRATGLSNDH